MNLITKKVILRDGREATVQSFSLDAMERLNEEKSLDQVANQDPKVRYAAMRHVAFEAVCESLPDLKREDMGKFISGPIFTEIMDAIAECNGWRKLDAGEESPPGEAPSPSTP